MLICADGVSGTGWQRARPLPPSLALSSARQLNYLLTYFPSEPWRFYAMRQISALFSLPGYITSYDYPVKISRSGYFISDLLEDLSYIINIKTSFYICNIINVIIKLLLIQLVLFYKMPLIFKYKNNLE